MGATCLRGGKHGDPSVTSPPLRRSPCSSIRKGVPLYGWKNGGRPPRDGFPPSRGCFVWGPEAGPRMRGRAPSSQACLRATGPALEISCPVHSVPGEVSGKRKSSLPPRGPRVFSWTPLASSSPTSARQSAQGRPGDLAPGRGAGRCSAPDGVGHVGGTHTHRGVLPGDSGLSPAWAVKSPALAQTAPPCPQEANLDLATATL